MEPIEQQLTNTVTELKELINKRDGEIKSLGTTLTETKTSLDAVRAKMAEQQVQLDAVDAKTKERHVGEEGTEEKSISALITEHPDYIEAKKHDFTSRKPVTMHFDSSAFSRKSVITGAGLGVGTAGPLMPQQMAGITGLAQQGLRVRDLINVRRQTEGSSFYWLRQTTRTNNVSPQGEGGAKTESTYNWSVQTGTIRTLAHYTNVSRQGLSDAPWLRAMIDSELIYGLKLKEEAEILAGSGLGEHLNGIITQAAAFDTNLMPASNWTLIDVLRVAKLQSRLAGLATFAPSGFVLHPQDAAYLELVKDTTGRYIIGDPKTGTKVMFIWDLPVVESDSISQGTFLVGPFANGVDLVDRQQVSVEISYEHASNFTSNLATILAEERIGLGVRTPSVFITGTMASSPA